MKLVDSSGWLEFFTDGPLAEEYLAHFHPFDQILTPTIVLYEVYKKIRRERASEEALMAVAQLEKTRVVDLTPGLALLAGDLALQHGLAMADAIVYATAQSSEATVITSDSDFAGLPGVLYLERLPAR